MAEASARRSFGPTVLAGLATAGLVAVASNQRLAEPRPIEERPDVAVAVTLVGSQLPLTLALSLVVLACWGVLLVTRGRVRRALAFLAATAALGTLAAVVAERRLLVDSIERDFRELGVAVSVDVGAWWWVALVAAVLAVVPAVVAVLRVGAWPEMGTRYDAPGETQAAAAPDEERTNIDLWKAIDEGRDPTQ